MLPGALCVRPIRSCLRLVLLAAATWFFADCAAAQSSREQIEAALQNITSLVRADHVGYATVWDGNKYVQCRRMPDRSMRCEAASSAMQPSLARILVPARLERLAALGWTLDPRFGNYAQVFPESATAASIADRILKTLIEAYAAQERIWNSRRTGSSMCRARRAAGSARISPAV